MTFTVAQRFADIHTTKVKGERLSRKPIGGRGRTEDPKVNTPGTAHQRLHAIGDQFGGSGFRISGNIVSGSKSLNDEMQRIEDQQIKPFVANSEFSLEVDIEYEQPDPSKAQAAAVEIITEEAAKRIQAQNVATRVSEFVKQMSDKTVIPARRIVLVSYTVTLTDVSGKPMATRSFNCGPDKQWKPTP
jgi:hypothetical protein